MYSPAHVTDAPPQVVDHIALADNTVERAVKGFYLPLTSIGHARVSNNKLTDVGDAAIRLGSDNDASFPTQRDIDVRDNAVRHVTGESDANGIKVLGVDGMIVGNEVEDVASEDGTDSEGIYTKGHGHLIAGNHLRDAGRTQAQITVKSDSTTVADNVIVTEEAETNGIRVEGLERRPQRQPPARRSAGIGRHLDQAHPGVRWVRHRGEPLRGHRGDRDRDRR